MCELKLDGMSLALVYSDGRLERGITRGDGTTGEDVTLNVRTVRSIPLSVAKDKLKKAGIPADFEVRGEMLMPLAAFRKLNEEREKQGLAVFANPRNFTAGTVRQLEPSITAQRRMDYFAYMLLKDGTHLFRSPIQNDGCAGAGRVQGESESQAGQKSGRGLEVYSELGRQSANRCLTKLTASSSKSTSRLGSGNWASPGRLRAGRLLTSSRRAAASRRLKTSFGAGWPHRKAHSGGLAEAGSDRRARWFRGPRCTTWISSSNWA
jgi:hypothetical protein